MSTPPFSVPDTIRAELARRNLTQGALCDVLGITQTNVSLRMRGEREFRLSELVAIAKFLDVPLNDLLAGVAA